MLLLEVHSFAACGSRWLARDYVRDLLWASFDHVLLRNTLVKFLADRTLG